MAKLHDRELFRTSHSYVLLSILREMPEGRVAGKLKGKIATGKDKRGREDDSRRTDAPQLR